MTSIEKSSLLQAIAVKQDQITQIKSEKTEALAIASTSSNGATAIAIAKTCNNKTQAVAAAGNNTSFASASANTKGAQATASTNSLNTQPGSQSLIALAIALNDTTIGSKAQSMGQADFRIFPSGNQPKSQQTSNAVLIMPNQPQSVQVCQLPKLKAMQQQPNAAKTDQISQPMLNQCPNPLMLLLQMQLAFLKQLIGLYNQQKQQCSTLPQQQMSTYNLPTNSNIFQPKSQAIAAVQSNYNQSQASAKSISSPQEKPVITSAAFASASTVNLSAVAESTNKTNTSAASLAIASTSSEKAEATTIAYTEKILQS